MLDPDDQCLRLDKIYQSEEIEEQGPPGPPCFGPRIMHEPAVQFFQLGRVTKPYNGSTKPQDWLTDYVSSMNIAGGQSPMGGPVSPAYARGASSDLAEQLACWEHQLLDGFGGGV